MTPIENMRIRLYGVQGSGSVFPSQDERLAYRQASEVALLREVFDDLARHADADGRLDARIEDLIGGPLSSRSLRAYRQRFEVPEPPVFGGWTTCVRVETADGDDIVLDCGSGFRVCAKDMMGKWGDSDAGRDLYILGSHAHLDHTEGFDQAAVCFDPRNRIQVWSHREFLHALDQNLGIFSHHVEARLKGVQTPLNYEKMPASFESVEIRDFAISPPGDVDRDALVGRYHDLGTPFTVGSTRIQAIELFHSNTCFGYRIERNGKVFVFCTDHELRHGPDVDDPRQKASLEAEARLKQHAMGADLLYRDGQFLRAEYDGHLGIGSPHGVSRLDWGHSCIEEVIDMAIECGVKHTCIGHHDPNRVWSERNWIGETLRRKSAQSGTRIELAKSEMVIDL